MKRNLLLSSMLLPGLAAFLSAVLSGAPVSAQPAPGPAPARPAALTSAPAPAPPGSPTLGAASPQEATTPTSLAPSPSAEASAPAAPDALATALGARPGGMTPDEVGKLAASDSARVRIRQAELRAAAAKVDQALISYFPRLIITASYTRQSRVDNSLGLGGAVVAATNPGSPLTTIGCPTPEDPARTCVADAGGALLRASPASVEIPVFQNSYSFVASLSLPISDWVLRMSKGLSAAGHGERAKKLQVKAEQLQVAADAKITFLNWVRAKGQLVVAQQHVAQAKAHLDDARRGLTVGLTPKADVLRLEAQVAGADQVLTEADAYAVIVEQQLRQSLGLAADRALEIGIDVMGDAKVGGPVEPLDVLQKRALEKRLEIRALDETQHALKDAEDVTSAGYLPRLDLFANGTFANPNPRFFPQKQEWDFTWDAGVRLTWIVNETFITSPAVAEAKANTSVVAEQRTLVRDALTLEVASAYTETRKAASSIEAANRGLAAAEESLRVSAELFRSGKASSVDLIDAQTEVTRARLRRLDAHVGLLVARTRLDHATGRDVPADPGAK